MRNRGQDEYAQPEFWDRLVLRDPALTLRTARQALRSDSGDAPTAMLARSAVAKALFELGRSAEAVREARLAVAISEQIGRGPLRTAVGMSAAAIVVEAGHLDEGMAMLDALQHDADDIGRGRLELQAAYLLHHAGHLPEAGARMDHAAAILAASDDDRDLVRVHLNRGLLHLQQGHLSEAQRDLEAGLDVAERAGMTAYAAQIHGDLGVLHGRARRLDVALRHFERAADRFAAASAPGRAVAIMEIDRAEVMMHSGLLADAVDAAAAAVHQAEGGGNRVVLGDAQLVLARALAVAGRSREAVHTAQRARHTLGTSGRRDMTLHADAIGAAAALEGPADDVVREAIAESEPILAGLLASGWSDLALDLRVARLRAAWQLGALDTVADDVASLRLGTFSDDRPAALPGWYAEAIARAGDGDLAAAIDAAKAGLDLLDAIVAEADTLDRRSAAMRLGNDLSQLVIDLAIDLGDAGTVFGAAEGTRARALHDEVAAGHHRPLTDDGARALLEELTARLGERILVEWVVSGRGVHAVVLAAGALRLVDLGPVDAVVRALDRVVVWLDRAAEEPDAPSAAAVRAAALLDALIVEPLGLPPDAGVVVVPVGMLHGVPWAGLPSLADRSVSVSPNAQLWLAADRAAAVPASTAAMVVGPDVARVAVERSAFLAAYGGGVVVGVADSTPDRVREVLAGIDLVHVAAHGTFRSDRPLLSTLRLAPGETTLYDAAPEQFGARLVVLSSCEGGAHGTADGSEVLGLAAVMLARGVACVLAPLTLVRELECVDFVAEVHAEFAPGRAFGAAVAAVRRRWLADDDLSRWAVASSFGTFGSDAGTVAAETPPSAAR